MGQHLKYSTPELFRDKALEYFAHCKKEQKPYTITGLCLFMGITVLTFSHYKERAEFEEIVNLIRLQCEDWIVENMLTNKANATAAIFNLKNNYGWKDQAQLDVTSNGEGIFSAEQMKEAAKEILYVESTADQEEEIPSLDEATSQIDPQ